MEELAQHFTETAALLGEKSRAAMLWSLLDGRAYTATELALCAGISPQSASNHLAKLVHADLLAVQKQGKHRYYTYRSPEVAQVIEHMASLLPRLPGQAQKSVKRSLPPPGTAHARTCYDHLAGALGVALAEALLQKGFTVFSENQFAVTPPGAEWLRANGIEVEMLQAQKRSFAHACLDWSERKHHLAGSLGAAILKMLLEKDWLRRVKDSRAVVLTGKGRNILKEQLGVDMFRTTGAIAKVN